MIYSQFESGKSDVYVMRRSNGMLLCFCSLVKNEHERPEDMITHLLIHRSIGHRVPQRVIDRLNQERFGLFPAELDTRA